MLLHLRKGIALVLALLAQQAEQKDFKSLGELSGTDSAIERPFSVMVTDEKDFNQLWRQHKEIFGDPPNLGSVAVIDAHAPKVDFKKNVVIAYFAGQTQGVAGYSLVDVDAKGKTILVRIVPEMLGTNIQMVANSFGMWVFPKPKKPIELELVMGRNQQGQYLTRPLGRFEPPKTNPK